MQKFTISVFVNSGTQIRFIPLYATLGENGRVFTQDEITAMNLPEEYAQIGNMPRLSNEWRNEFRQEATGARWSQVDPEMAYLRYKFGNLKLVRPGDARVIFLWGFFLAVETNMGSAQRGYILSRRLPTLEETGRFAEDPVYRPELLYLSATDKIHGKVNTWELSLLGTLDLTVSIVWKEPNSKDITDVNLVLDFGNTRTLALLLEEQHGQAANMFKSYCKPLMLNANAVNDTTSVSSAIVDSWFILHQPVFEASSDRELMLEQEEWSVQTRHQGFWVFKKAYLELDEVIIRRPQMFAKSSIVKIGSEANAIFSEKYIERLIARGARLEQSSPKRYYWDQRMVGKNNTNTWSMVLNKEDAHYGSLDTLPPLSGELLRFMREDGEIMDIDREVVDFAEPKPGRPGHPRAATLTWMLIEILEKCWSLLNSSAFHENGAFKERRIKNLIATYPSGWTQHEIACYKERFQEALNIFQIMNFPRDERRIMLNMSIDEAVASQLPIVFSEIHRLGDDSIQWLRIAGKERGGHKAVRIMNIDIGGGTSDIAVVEYQGNDIAYGVDLKSTLLFKDGAAIAGDDLLKRIIEEVLLPNILVKSDNPREIIEKFTMECSNLTDSSERSRHVRLCLIPVATTILSSLSARRDIRALDPIADANIIENNWREFEEYARIPAASNRIIEFDPEAVNTLIREVFCDIFRICAIYAANYDVDMVILSGKTTELPEILKLAREHLPIFKERIVVSLHYKTGDWYPFGTRDIGDAKSVTAVGCALYYALNTGLISNWSLHCESSPVNLARNEWNIYGVWMNDPGKSPLLDANRESASCKILVNTIIGRRKNAISQIEPVYRLVWKDGSKGRGNIPLEVELKRVVEQLNDVTCEEKLVIQKVSGEYVNKGEKIQVTAEDFELEVWPCAGNDFNFWQDTGRFDRVGELPARSEARRVSVEEPVVAVVEEEIEIYVEEEVVEPDEPEPVPVDEPEKPAEPVLSRETVSYFNTDTDPIPLDRSRSKLKRGRTPLTRE